MKKYLFVSLLLLLAHAQVTKAEATDISTKDNLVYVMPLTAAQGDKAVDLCFAMKNSAEIRGFQMKIYLPEGVTAAKSSNGRIQYTLNQARLPENHEQQAIFSDHTDDSGDYILMTCSSQYDERFSVGDGLIFSFKVNIADGMELGDYPVILKEMKLSETDISKYYVTDYVEGTLTIEENDGRIKFDEASTSLPTYTAGEKGDVTMTRTIKAGNWSTIVFPFNLTKGNATAVFGDDVTFAKFSRFDVDYGDDEENVTPLGITVYFTTYTIPARGNLAGGTRRQEVRGEIMACGTKVKMTMKKEYIEPLIKVSSIDDIELLSGSVVVDPSRVTGEGDDVDLDYGGIDTGGDKDPEARLRPVGRAEA